MSDVFKTLSMLQRFRLRIYKLSVNGEAVTLKRARSDADLTLILLELASLLSEEERCVVEDIVSLHNQLWDLRG